MSFGDLWHKKCRGPVNDLLAIVADEAVGVVAGAEGRTTEGDVADLELLLLPLSHRGQTRMRMMGVLTPLAVPFWLGSSQLEPMTLGSLRHLGPAVETIVAPRLVSDLPVAERRRGFVVYEGGRSGDRRT